MHVKGQRLHAQWATQNYRPRTPAGTAAQPYLSSTLFVEGSGSLCDGRPVTGFAGTAEIRSV
ncbi:hypothetical protein ADL25_37740 [Streptomyces sp. NRRL F-5122]|nr:hypothetical protein ADL25_37740 [Streptomyces sp. NRRL F-5122]